VADKQSFYEDIKENSIINEDFFKKVYGYSVCDDPFLTTVANKLISISRKDVVQAYNEWFSSWQKESKLAMKSVSEWYSKECDKQFERLLKEQQRRR